MLSVLLARACAHHLALGWPLDVNGLFAGLQLSIDGRVRAYMRLIDHA